MWQAQSESKCSYLGRSVPVRHQCKAGEACSSGRTGLMGQKSAEVIVPAWESRQMRNLYVCLRPVAVDEGGREGLNAGN